MVHLEVRTYLNLSMYFKERTYFKLWSARPGDQNKNLKLDEKNCSENQSEKKEDNSHFTKMFKLIMKKIERLKLIP